MKVISNIFFRSAPFLMLFFAQPFSGWNPAYAEKTTEYVELRITPDGVVMVGPEGVFYGPYVVEAGDTFESISEKFYGTPDKARNLAAALGVPAVHIPLAGSIAYIGTSTLGFRFFPAMAGNQRKTVEEFLAMLPKDKRLEYKIEGKFGLTYSETGESILSEFDVKIFWLTSVNPSSPSLKLEFPLQPLRNLIRVREVLEGVTIQQKDTQPNPN